MDGNEEERISNSQKELSAAHPAQDEPQNEKHTTATQQRFVTWAQNRERSCTQMVKSQPKGTTGGSDKQENMNRARETASI
jgi:hypothetical protein